MPTVKCFVRTKSGPVIKCKSRNGADFKGPGGRYAAPNYANKEILEISRGILRPKLWAFYEEGTVNAIPIAQALKPQTYKPGDKENLEGDFLATLLRQALADESRIRTIAMITMIASLWAALVSTIGTYWIHGVITYFSGH